MSRKQPVMSVDKVDVRWDGARLCVRAQGSTPTLGWSGAVLESAGRRNGVLELTLLASPPPGMAAQAIGEVEADHAAADAAELRAVRVVASGNRMEVRVPRR